MNLHPGSLLLHYRIESLVARSGMASIFHATDTRDGQPVAIKIPHEEMEGDPVLYERFLREAEIGKMLDHPGVMKVYELPVPGRLYTVMEWVEGRPLRKIMGAERKLPPERAIAIVFGVLQALDYISPEQLKSRRGDLRSDLYSMGVMLYEMLSGETPFSGPNPFAIMNDRLLNNPVPPRAVNPHITPEMQEIIYRALEREPDKRYKSAEQFMWDLLHEDEVGSPERNERVDGKEGKSPIARRVMFYLAVALIPVVILGLLMHIVRHN